VSRHANLLLIEEFIQTNSLISPNDTAAFQDRNEVISNETSWTFPLNC